MDFEEFRALAEEIFEEIPAEFRDGVDGLDVKRKTVLHPSLPGVFTLGECLSEFYPSEFGGAGEVRSLVVLYYGSFVELSRSREDWDWEGELHETILHEVRHHLEYLADDDELEEMDYAEDQNFARREGQPFDPFFFQRGERIAPDTFRVDEDVFIERVVDRRSVGPGTEFALEWHGRAVRIAPPPELADVHFLRVSDIEMEGSGELHLVIVCRGGIVGWMRGLFGASVGVQETEVEALPA
jgi:predicted Zn-dependent protease with MMP-like domain